MLLKQVPKIYSERRNRLVASNEGVAFLVPCAPESIRNSDVFHPYRQESNLYYLSGFDEPNACLLILPPQNSQEQHHMVMFLQERNQTKEIWTGERYGLERAKTVFGAHEAYLYTEMDQKLPHLLKNVEKVYYAFGINKEVDKTLHRALEGQRALLGRDGKGLLPMFDSGPVIGEMRLKKDSHELEYLRKACEITAKGHLEIMKQARAGMNEREIQALIEYVFVKEGCERLGYPSIVASGGNATCLHYTRNNEVLKDGDLLLVDAGGEFGYYTSDITRTFPVGKTFSPEQSDVYDIVSEAHQKAMHMMKPGVTIPQIHDCTVDVIAEGLISLGLLKGSKSEVVDKATYKRFYPHRANHWLGMDVHDVGLYAKNSTTRPLESGMVLTLEPGVYCQPNDEDSPAAFRGIGVRIEDDILITDDGFENLTSRVVREKKDIEQIRSSI